MKLLDTLKKNIILEVSEKVKKQIIDRYKNVENVTDDENTIVSYLNDFEKYKDGFPADKRDLTNKNFTYDELKSLIDSKRQAKTIQQAFTEYKKLSKDRGDKISNDTELKIIIRKFFEIRDRLAKGKSGEEADKIKNIFNYKFLKLVEMMQKFYPKLISEILTERFKNDTSSASLKIYIQDYQEFYDEIPFTTKGANEMTWDDFEHLIDGIRAGKGVTQEKIDSGDVEKIRKVYEKDNVTIFAPKVKNECITLRNGRSWCTSAAGGSNLYYNYRFRQELTLYYIINENLPFDDLNYATVLLVDPKGKMKLADKSNQGDFGGHVYHSWDTIVKKLPFLEGLQSLFKPEPMTESERETYNKFYEVRINDNKTLQSVYPEEKDIEMWMEVNSKTLSDLQYENISTELQKKYIALGHDLTPNQIDTSTPETLKYYISKKIELLKSKSLEDLTAEDVRLLNKPQLAKMKAELKPKFAKSLTSQTGGSSLNISIKFDSGYRRDSGPGKFIMLYGFDSIFDDANAGVNSIMITNETENTEYYDVPSTIGKFVNADSIYLQNVVKTIPEEIGNCKKVTFLSFPKNPELRTLPWDAIHSLPTLGFLNLEDSKNIEFPADFDKYWEAESDISSGFFERIRRGKQ